MKRFHVKLLALVAAGACSDPGDVLYQVDPGAPGEVAPGVFRLTYGAGDEFARGALPDGRVLLVAHDVPGGPEGAALMSAAVTGGTLREEAGGYRAGLPGEIVTHLAVRPETQALLTTTLPVSQNHWCGDPAPRPFRAGWRLYALPPHELAPIANLLQSGLEFPMFEGTGRGPDGAFIPVKRIRLVPALAAAAAEGGNPWGPTVSPDGRLAYVSDTESIWRYDLTDSTTPPALVTSGAYPTLASAGDVLFFARPVIGDSVETVTSVSWTLFVSCNQTTVTYQVDRWLTVRRTLATGVEDTVGEGAEPTVLGDSALVVRRWDGLYHLRLADGVAQRLVKDSTAASPHAVADDGYIAFTSSRFGSADVLLLRLPD